jgi:hypothetical protein
MTLCMAIKNLTNSKLDSLCHGAKWPFCLMHIFNILHLNVSKVRTYWRSKARHICGQNLGDIILNTVHISQSR